MSKFVKALIVSGVLMGSGLVLGGIGEALISCGVEKKIEPQLEEQYFSADADDIKDIKVDFAAESVMITPTDGDKIKVTYWDDPEEPKYEIKEENGILTAGVKKDEVVIYFSLFSDWNKKEENEHAVNIEIPANYMGDYNLECSSGSINMSDLVVNDDLNIYISSGVISLENIECKGEMKLRATSGRLNMTEVVAEQDVDIQLSDGHIDCSDMSVAGKMGVYMTSGDFDAKQLMVTGDLELEASSGTMKFDTVTANYVSFDASSGNCSLENVTTETGLSVDMSSGTFNAALTDAMENYSIHTDLTSGSCNLPEEYINGDKKIEVDMTSGLVNVTFGEGK